MKTMNRRQFLGTGLAASAVFAFPAPALVAKNANEKVRLGSISCGGRARELQNQFNSFDDVDIVAICDPDESRRAACQKSFPSAKAFADLRNLLDDPDVDAVVVATCNHWHCLAAIWAMQAGKDVYVEKPLSHSQWEGRQTVAAARKYRRVCQLGTQQRSDAMQSEIKKFLHEEKGIGEILAASVNRYGVRPGIGKRETPIVVQKEVDYNLWLGPAQDLPIYRTALHYDWHWVWNTGSGEMGNWGVHVLDDCKNNVLLDSSPLPKRMLAGGGRIGYNDAGETPNIHFVLYDSGTIPVVLGLSNLAAADNPKSPGKFLGPGSGYIAWGEGGRLEGQRGSAVAFDKNGDVIRKFKGTGGQAEHTRNFIDAVRAGDRSLLNAEIQLGNDSTGWCNLANVAVRAGLNYSQEAAAQNVANLGKSSSNVEKNGTKLWNDLLDRTAEHLRGNGIDLENPDIKISPILEIDPETEKFVGEGSELANSFLKREYREPFVVPEIDA